MRGSPSTAPCSMAKPYLCGVVVRTRGTSTPETLGDSPLKVGVPVKLGASMRVEAKLSERRPVTMRLKGMPMMAEMVAADGEALQNGGGLSKGLMLGKRDRGG